MQRTIHTVHKFTFLSFERLLVPTQVTGSIIFFSCEKNPKIANITMSFQTTPIQILNKTLRNQFRTQKRFSCTLSDLKFKILND